MHKIRHIKIDGFSKIVLTGLGFLMIVYTIGYCEIESYGFLK